MSQGSKGMNRDYSLEWLRSGVAHLRLKRVGIIRKNALFARKNSSLRKILSNLSAIRCMYSIPNACKTGSVNPRNQRVLSAEAICEKSSSKQRLKSQVSLEGNWKTLLSKIKSSL